MKLLAEKPQPPQILQPESQSLKIDGTPFPIPQSIQPIMDKAGPFGINILTFGVSVLLTVAILIGLFSLIWGGVEWIISGGEKTKLQSARNRIIYSVFGLIISLLAFAIVLLITNFFGVPLIK
ncbi:MAG: hypothetical protein HYV37_00250 [Candidatus Levyibacteriota bacterium]|nr:MAG: hypothetical protein HYV37_00250 [Candidatus Levybacteria bacterium]